MTDTWLGRIRRAADGILTAVRMGWWLIAPLYVLCGFASWRAMYSETASPVLADALVLIFLLLLVLYIVAQVCLFRAEKVWQFFLSLAVGVLVVLPTTLFVSAAGRAMPDNFGKQHPIPEGLATVKPAPQDSILPVDSANADTYLQLYRTGVGGQYAYSFYYPALPEGEIYLQCYEAATNEKLSSMRRKTRCHVSRTTRFGCVVEKKKFLNVDGDPYDFYAVRVEVWHRDRWNRKIKLTEKIYVMDGWTF